MKKLSTIFYTTGLAAMSFVFATSSLQAIQYGKNVRKTQIAQADDTNSSTQDTPGQNDPSIGEKPGTIPNSMMQKKEPFNDNDADQKNSESLNNC